MTLLASAPVSPRSERGFTLAELLVAVVIFSIGLLALAGTASVIMTTLTSTQSRTIAAGVAESRFERIRTTACASRASGSAPTRGIPAGGEPRPPPRAGGGVAGSLTVLGHPPTRRETVPSILPCL